MIPWLPPCEREPGSWMTCDAGRMELLSWGVSYPPVSAVVLDAQMECGPDVAPRSRAWKARPDSPLSRDPAPVAQVRSLCDRPLLTVRDRQMPMVRARGGHGRRGRSWLCRGGNGHMLNRRVRPFRGDHLPRWQAPEGVRGRAYPPCLPARGLRRGSSCYSPHGILGSPAGGSASREPRRAASDSPRRPPVPAGQVRLSADDYGATMPVRSSHVPRAGSSRCDGL